MGIMLVFRSSMNASKWPGRMSMRVTRSTGPSLYLIWAAATDMATNEKQKIALANRTACLIALSPCSRTFAGDAVQSDFQWGVEVYTRRRIAGQGIVRHPMSQPHARYTLK